MQEPRLNAAFPIVEEDGTMSHAFRDFMTEVGFSLPLTGTGSPEGVVEAVQFSVYLDTAGGAGTIQYRKMLTDIGGDRSKGWALV